MSLRRYTHKFYSEMNASWSTEIDRTTHVGWSIALCTILNLVFFFFELINLDMKALTAIISFREILCFSHRDTLFAYRVSVAASIFLMVATRKGKD